MSLHIHLFILKIICLLNFSKICLDFSKILSLVYPKIFLKSPYSLGLPHTKELCLGEKVVVYDTPTEQNPTDT